MPCRSICALTSTLLLLLATGCSRDLESELDPVSDSVAASQPITPDTIRSSARNPRHLAMVRDTVLQGSADSTTTGYLSGSQRMTFGANYFALYSAGNLKVYDLTGKHLWSTSRYEFAPGQVRNAKKNAFSGRGGSDIGDWIEFAFDNDEYAPGAITSVAGMEILRDSIVIVQPGKQVNIYSRAGRSIAITGLGENDSFSQSAAGISSSRAGWLLLQQVIPERAPANPSAVEFWLQRVSITNGETGPALRTLKVQNDVVRVRNQGPGQREFVGRPLIVATPQARLAKGTTYWTTARDFTFDLFDEYGRLKRVVIVDTEVVPVTQHLVNSYAESASRTWATRAADGDSAAAFWLREVLPKIRQLPLPKHRPVIGNVWIGDDGSIAVRRADLARVPADTTDSLVVDVLDTDGRYRGRVAFEQPGRNVIHFTGRAFYVAETAGTLMRSDSARIIRSQGRDRSGRMSTSTFVLPPIIYQRLVRYTISSG